MKNSIVICCILAFLLLGCEKFQSDKDTDDSADPNDSSQGLTADKIPDLISVSTVQLPEPMLNTNPGFGIRISNRHGFYAASPQSDYHAILYNGKSGTAWLVLLDSEDNIHKSIVIGQEEVRGLEFQPDGQYLVALISGGTGVWPSPSFFVKLTVPDLNEVWRKPIKSHMVGLEKWTPDNSNTIAVSNDRYVLHSAGNCRDGKWCEGHQGDMTQVLDAATGDRLGSEGENWRASHSCKQMIAYNEVSNTFLLANAGDQYPKALQFNTFKEGTHKKNTASFASWGNGGGRQGITQGAIKAEASGGGFASVWSYAEGGQGNPDKLYFATFDETGSFIQQPKQVFSGGGTQIGGNLIPLEDGRWLIAYTESPEDLITDYLLIYFDNWNIPDDIRTGGSRMAIVDSQGNVQGEPVDISVLGAYFPVEINHLMKRPDGISWMAMDGKGASQAFISTLRYE